MDMRTHQLAMHRIARPCMSFALEAELDLTLLINSTVTTWNPQAGNGSTSPTFGRVTTLPSTQWREPLNIYHEHRHTVAEPKARKTHQMESAVHHQEVQQPQCFKDLHHTGKTTKS